MNRTGRALLIALIAAAGVAPHAHAQSGTAFLDHEAQQKANGEQIFTHICQGCHMADAKGAQGAGTYPALAGNPKLASPQYPMAMVLNGRGAMPPFGRLFSDEQVAGVVNYLRSHFGNHYSDTISAADVKAMRP
ncbi:MAG TPA: cytochrome c [Luteibacter sp.]|jgi:mono/diheme cytochrome c family protein|nr:cytochrome c [Luteibacter sp.]